MRRFTHESTYSNVPNKRACTFISGKVCLLTLIEPRTQTLPEITVHARLLEDFLFFETSADASKNQMLLQKDFDLFFKIFNCAYMLNNS